MIIRREEEKDYREVENLIREAFWNVYRPGCLEHFVLHNMRKDDCFIKDLDYCLEVDGKIIAQIAYSKAYITNKEGEQYEVAVFGPLSVLPNMQKRGYGSKLIEFTLNKAKELGYPLVAISGNPDFYHKFGFDSASKFGIFYEGVEEDKEMPFFMVKILDSKKAKKISGVYSEPKVYFVDESEVDNFDKEFPLKIKEKREGQIF